MEKDKPFGSAVADRIIALLEEGDLDVARWRSRAAELERELGAEVYSVLLFVLTHLDFPPERAREHWGRVLKQWEQLNERLPEGADLRVAVLQYFLRIQRKLKNPAIVEIRILRKTQASVILDELTRLFNFRHFLERLKSEVKRAQRYATPLCLLMVDVDDFKAFNDTHGHLAGNVALRRLARALKRSVREVDVVARYGGEEFAILLPNTPKSGALQVAEKVRAAVARAGIGRREDGRGRGVTVSIGVGCLPGDSSEPEALIERADRALYRAKSLGKNRVQPFSDERREFTRIETELIGNFKPLADRSYPISTLNLSEGGILFNARQSLVVGSMLHVQLALPPAGDPIDCVVRVVRVTEEPEGYEVGARIVEMERAHQRRFRVFLAKLRAAEEEPLCAATPPVAS